jgi:hypothetical protein
MSVSHLTGHAARNTSKSAFAITIEVTRTARRYAGFPLRRVGSGKRTTFTHIAEQWLSRWMAENAFVTWCPCPEPWQLEELVIRRLRVPLNIAHNGHESFCATLSIFEGTPSLMR